MNEEVTIEIVKGYHVNTPVPQLALREKLAHRSAFIVDTQLSPCDGRNDYICRVVIDVIAAVSSVLDYDDLEIIINETTSLKSLDLIERCLASMPISDRIPPERIIYRKNGSIVAVEETESWALVGGPYPYSDSWTLSFYTTHDISRVCLSDGWLVNANRRIMIGRVHNGSPVQITESRLRRLVRRVFEPVPGME